MWTITEMSGLGASAPWVEQRTTEPVPDRLNSQQSLTLRLLDKSEQVVSRMFKISKHAANVALGKPAGFALGRWTHCGPWATRRSVDAVFQAFRMY